MATNKIRKQAPLIMTCSNIIHAWCVVILRAGGVLAVTRPATWDESMETAGVDSELTWKFESEVWFILYFPNNDPLEISGQCVLNWSLLLCSLGMTRHATLPNCTHLLGQLQCRSMPFNLHIFFFWNLYNPDLAYIPTACSSYWSPCWKCHCVLQKPDNKEPATFWTLDSMPLEPLE